MPELPEVETIKNQLKEKIVGKTIKEVKVNLPKMIKGLSAKEFITKVKGAKVKDVARRAKLLIIFLSSGDSLIIHLKLTGQIIYKNQIKNQNYKHAHIIYHFKDKSVLFHNDLRQFGYVRLMETANLPEFFLKEKFGPEPLEKNFTLEKFRKIIFQKPRREIKPLLMDQNFIAGVGNVYASETCFCAKVLPTRMIENFKDDEIKNIYQCLLNILRAAIKFQGTSADAYLDIHGREGRYLSKLKVYGREGEKCLRCGGQIKKIILKGRGTFYCPKCQR